ncbi:hypothetical protein Y1Q_0019682 [Alligator mississippiensis]|uniref:Uncharacterized protein n=1 Tax=Alligator mississippiensis TaxID=8496 RepID=A0A151PF03_ALLMI|nr:hypothetical protein Y1Q_0019682 [Alligator mississippiensis]
MKGAFSLKRLKTTALHDRAQQNDEDQSIPIISPAVFCALLHSKTTLLLVFLLCNVMSQMKIEALGRLTPMYT